MPKANHFTTAEPVDCGAGTHFYLTGIDSKSANAPILLHAVEIKPDLPAPAPVTYVFPDWGIGLVVPVGVVVIFTLVLKLLAPLHFPCDPPTPRASSQPPEDSLEEEFRKMERANTARDRYKVVYNALGRDESHSGYTIPVPKTAPALLDDWGNPR